jgi:uncharacterized membrane protein
MHQVFSIEESLKFGWQKTKTHSTILFQVLLTIFALNVVFQIVDKVLQDTAMGFLASVILSVASVVINIGFMIIALKIARGEEAVYKDIIPPAQLVWSVFIASFLVGILVLVGLVFLIVPGVYFALRFSMASYAVIDGARVLESFKKSTELTEGYKWQLLGLFLVFLLINIIGAIPFGLGLLVTIPVTMIASAHVYQSLKNRPREALAAHSHEGHERHDHSGHDHA